MNRALSPDHMQRESLKCQQDQYLPHQQMDQCGYNGHFSGLFGSGFFSDPGLSVTHVLTGGGIDGCSLTGSVQPDPCFENIGVEVPGSGFGCERFGNGSGHDVDYAYTAVNESVSSEKAIVRTRRSESFNKRKIDEVGDEEDPKEKKMKGSEEEEGEDSKITEQNTSSTNTKKNKNKNKKENSSNGTSKEDSKVTEVQKLDYIHVRARRGQATDSHSLAERVRREKISERMKYLQDLVPGCNKITGKAGMLDEIINYVQSLQRQVEFLSMKLAAVNPRLDSDINDIFIKQVFSDSISNFPNIGIAPSSGEMTNPAFGLQFNPMQQVASCPTMEMEMNPNNNTSVPSAIPESFLDPSCFTNVQIPSTWNGHELQNLYSNADSFPSQPFSGSMSTSNLKMEM